MNSHVYESCIYIWHAWWGADIAVYLAQIARITHARTLKIINKNQHKQYSLGKQHSNKQYCQIISRQNQYCSRSASCGGPTWSASVLLCFKYILLALQNYGKTWACLACVEILEIRAIKERAIKEDLPESSAYAVFGNVWVSLASFACLSS